MKKLIILYMIRQAEFGVGEAYLNYIFDNVDYNQYPVTEIKNI